MRLEATAAETVGTMPVASGGGARLGRRDFILVSSPRLALFVGLPISVFAQQHLGASQKLDLLLLLYYSQARNGDTLLSGLQIRLVQVIIIFSKTKHACFVAT